MTVDYNLVMEILNLNEEAKQISFEKKRFNYSFLEKDTDNFIGLMGLRGSGKTVLLKQYLKEHENTIYISLDSVRIDHLYEIVKYFRNERNIKTFLLDEIHNYPNWQRDLKKIYDFLNVKVFFTSSIALDITKSVVDLSRRVFVQRIYPFSFREYLYFSKNILKEKITIDDILYNDGKLVKIINYDFLFEDYINGGLLPGMLKARDFSIFENIANKVIENDLPKHEPLTEKDIFDIRNMLEFIATSPIDDISYSSIAKNVGITKYKAMKYVDLLEKSFILNVIKPKGTNVTKEPKILFMPPFRRVFSKSRMYDLGAQREEFFIMVMTALDYPVMYLKSRRGMKTPDYYVEMRNKRYIFEIGGKSKNTLQLKNFKDLHGRTASFVLTIPSVLSDMKRPLVGFGFLY